MTNAQVKDFAKVLLQASDTELSDETLTAYLNKRTRTRVVNLTKLVPIELRYETIVLEDGVLHIYRDVYAQNTNTEEKLREVFKASGVDWNDLANEEKLQMQEALNAMSPRPKKMPLPKPATTTESNAANTIADANERKAEAERWKNLRSRKEIVIESTALRGKGYPAPVNLDTGERVAASPPASLSPSTNKP